MCFPTGLLGRRRPGLTLNPPEQNVTQSFSLPRHVATPRSPDIVLGTTLFQSKADITVGGSSSVADLPETKRLWQMKYPESSWAWLMDFRRDCQVKQHSRWLVCPGREVAT